MPAVTDDHATLATRRPASALPGPDFHRLDRTSLAWRTHILPLKRGSDSLLRKKKKGDLEAELPVTGRTIAALNVVKSLCARIECLTSGFEHPPIPTR